MSLTCCFANTESNVGETISAQISLKYTAHRGPVISPSSVRVNLEGYIRSIRLLHDVPDKAENSTRPKQDGSEMLVYVDHLREEDGSAASATMLNGSADLVIPAGYTKTFQISLHPREAGIIRFSSAVLHIDNERFELEESRTLDCADEAAVWRVAVQDRIRRKRQYSKDALSIRILPKPPKMEVIFPNLSEQYFTDEKVMIDLHIINGEDQEVDSTLAVRLLAHSPGSQPTVVWKLDQDEMNSSPNDNQLGDDNTAVHLPERKLGSMAPFTTRECPLTFTATSSSSEYILEVRIHYHFVNEPARPLSKTTTANISVVTPFEANYDLKPQLHPDHWPSYFSLESPSGDTYARNEGLPARWSLDTIVASFAHIPIYVSEISLRSSMPTEVANCNISTVTMTDSSLPFQPGTSRKFASTLDIRRRSLEEKQPLLLDLALDVRWSRSAPTSDATHATTTTLAVPRLPTHAVEPRVLCSIPKDVSTDIEQAVPLTYTIENPTLHFLTFDVIMEADESFAFSGPKSKSLNLLPMSRVRLSYVLLVIQGEKDAQGDEWVSPELRVVDRYFGKQLKIFAAGSEIDGIKANSGEVWVRKQR